MISGHYDTKFYSHFLNTFKHDINSNSWDMCVGEHLSYRFRGGYKAEYHWNRIWKTTTLFCCRWSLSQITNQSSLSLHSGNCYLPYLPYLSSFLSFFSLWLADALPLLASVGGGGRVWKCGQIGQRWNSMIFFTYSFLIPWLLHVTAEPQCVNV